MQLAPKSLITSCETNLMLGKECPWLLFQVGGFRFSASLLKEWNMLASIYLKCDHRLIERARNGQMVDSWCKCIWTKCLEVVINWQFFVYQFRLYFPLFFFLLKWETWAWSSYTSAWRPLLRACSVLHIRFKRTGPWGYKA